MTSKQLLVLLKVSCYSIVKPYHYCLIKHCRYEKWTHTNNVSEETKNKNVSTIISSVVRKDPISRIPVSGLVVSFPWRRLVGLHFLDNDWPFLISSLRRRSFDFGRKWSPNPTWGKTSFIATNYFQRLQEIVYVTGKIL